MTTTPQTAPHIDPHSTPKNSKKTPQNMGQKLPIPVVSSFDDMLMLKLAREVAMDMRDLASILETHGIDQAQFDLIAASGQFQRYLRQSLEEWNSAVNTAERVKIKSLAFVEESLPEFYARAHDPQESLNAKVEVLKTVARFAGVGGSVDGAVAGERLSVTINLGAGRELKIEKDITPRSSEIIEGERL